MALKLEDFMQWPEIEALEYGECGNPELVLGPRMADRSHVLVTAYIKEADSVRIKNLETGKKYTMEKMDEEGYYAAFIPAKKIPSYRLIVKKGKTEKELPDPYGVESMIDGMDESLFINGEHDTIYNKLGAHLMKIDGIEGTYFAV